MGSSCERNRRGLSNEKWRENERKRIGKGSSKARKEKKGKQSTLDSFVGIAEKESETNPVRENDAEESICDHHIDNEAAKTWIYPVNVPLRDYQFHIAQTALFQNTLVALPTGLGKTLIVAVVMYTLDGLPREK